MRAIIAGTSMLGSGMLRGKTEEVATAYGKVPVVRVHGTVLLDRHRGKPPHAIDWKANMAALKELEVDEAIGVSSVGSLKREIAPGSIFVPSDYINFSPVTVFEDEIRHITPELDGGLRRGIIRVLERLGLGYHEGVYWQSRGPRLETKAEVRMIMGYADVAGMTMASEATVCMETGIRYAAVCTVDNYAHGIGEKPSYEGIVKSAREKMGRTERIVRGLAE